MASEAKVYPVNHERYSYVVRFRRKGFEQYNRYFRTKEEAETDCEAFNKKLFEEGRQGLTIGPRERRHLEAFMLVCKERNLTIAQATDIIRGTKPKGGRGCEETMWSLIELRETQGRSDRTLNGIRLQCLSLFDHCGRSKIEDVTRQDVIDFVFAAKMPNSQISRFAACTNLFNHAVKLGWLDKSPAAGIEKPKKKKQGAAKVFLPEEAENFMREIEGFKGGILASYFAILLFAGLRPSEVYPLTRTDIRKKSIRVEGGKMEGRARRNAPISDNLRAWLDAYEDLPLMPDNLNELSNILKEARALSPVEWVPDICRHTYGSYRMAITEDEKKVGREMGTAPDTIYKHYFEAMELEDAEEYPEIMPARKSLVQKD